MEERGGNTVAADQTQGREVSTEISGQGDVEVDPNREVIRAVEASGTLNLHGEINLANSIARSNNVYNDHRVYKPHYGDVHQHVTNNYHVQTEYFVRGDTRSDEQGDVTTRQRKPKKKISLRIPRKAPAPYKLAGNRMKPPQDQKTGRELCWMLVVSCGAALLISVLCIGVWVKTGSIPNDTKTDGKNEGHGRMITLYDACRTGNLGDIDKLLHAGTADINDTTRSGRTCLHIASKGGRLDIVDYLVRHNASVNAMNKLKRTPLHEASKNGHADIVRKLCQHGADVNAVDTKGKTPLIEAIEHGHSVTESALFAVMQGHTKVVEILLENRADVYHNANTFASPLVTAIATNKTEIVDLILKYGSSKLINAGYGPDEITPLEMALLNGNVNTFKTLLRHGANPAIHTLEFRKRNNARHIIFYTLQNTTAFIKTEYLKALLDHRVSPDQRLNEGLHTTALLIAIGKNATENVKLLLEYGARTDAPVDALTPLYLAVYLVLPHIVEILLKSGANIEQVDSACKLTPLGVAARTGHDDVAQVLLKHNASVNVMSDEGTPLYLAAKFGHEAVARLLIKHNANVELRENKLNSTPLAVASEQGHVEIVKLLLSHGANPNATVVIFMNNTQVPDLIKKFSHSLKKTTADIEYYMHEYENSERSKDHIFLQTTPLIQAVVNNHTHVVNVLLSYGADTETRLRELTSEITPLCYASSQGYVEIIRALLQHGADVNAKGYEGQTALHVAASAQRPSSVPIIDLLLEYGADMSIKNDNGVSARVLVEQARNTIFIEGDLNWFI